MATMTSAAESDCRAKTIIYLMNKLGISELTFDIADLVASANGNKETDLHMRVNYVTQTISVKITPVSE